jgi:hypothetical protein
MFPADVISRFGSAEHDAYKRERLEAFTPAGIEPIPA